MGSIQYNAALAMTGTIRGSSREKVCQELSRIIYSIISLPLEVHTEQETLTIFFNSMLGILFSEIHTSDLLSHLMEECRQKYNELWKFFYL